MNKARRSDICATACADLFLDSGKILGHAIGVMPTIGARLARATFAPDLVLTDGEVYGVTGVLPLGATSAEGTAREAWLPYRTIFDVCFSGRRHIIMGASQLDRHGNQNIACIGNWDQPTSQLIGVRGAPGNTVNHATSYWIPKHSTRVFVEQVDFVSGLGTDRAAALGQAGRFASIGGVVTNLAVLDVGGEGGTLRLRSTHPGVTVDEVMLATGCPLELADDLKETRVPTDDDLALLSIIDPHDARSKEVPG